jgi:hypothetical protein
MIIRKSLVALASAGLLIGSTAAAAAPVAAPVGETRTASPVDDSEQLGRGAGWLWILAILIAVAVGGLLLADDNNPASP